MRRVVWHVLDREKLAIHVDTGNGLEAPKTSDVTTVNFLAEVLPSPLDRNDLSKSPSIPPQFHEALKARVLQRLFMGVKDFNNAMFHKGEWKEAIREAIVLVNQRGEDTTHQLPEVEI